MKTIIIAISLFSILFGEKKKEVAPELYETVVLYIKAHEGLRLKNYNCIAGVNTIGWGHVILPHENFKKISLKQANELFLKDFNKRYELAKKTFPNLERRKLLVLTASSFNLGTGIFLNKNSVVKAIKSGKSIRFALIKYCLVNGKYNQVISNRRKFESMLYEMSDNQVKKHKDKFRATVLKQIKNAIN